MKNGANDQTVARAQQSLDALLIALARIFFAFTILQQIKPESRKDKF